MVYCSVAYSAFILFYTTYIYINCKHKYHIKIGGDCPSIISSRIIMYIITIYIVDNKSKYTKHAFMLLFILTIHNINDG